ncbi:MAG: hypothetical protein JGK17_01810 [Microcoleus sp. PH2017_10_PVI_O_A]|uniref:hypothetical protein n=1 Tax=unclassified Microcoleus TaxID=2642155 RepID=UPI001DAC2336|nr:MULTISPECIES: hypothetical protein [unclassified Microcoleus]TAE82717.1 MAG: hypothetical protein EAZ83_11765 [Oscillatoriales cyanobacterium]MCC3404350.1 hypothetical protein [Microcoleus sp. PH2017_10_PVI_O_A]MCC3458440.1 hypothetical protein [Microcoleus sp. PH2017_11_PCY_U_A]MCC3477300.1 hypothetical protein [Microcoleus sp. PH2017_12_PCY_D_A]MCC3530487.1 hypothetical protein [Microcoleus sp. PH2017_21_RUC_O_A]
MKDFKLINKGQELLKITLINLALLLVFLELGSLGWYFVKHKQFFYTREKAQDKSALGINLEGVRLNQSIVERFHPFFGFIQKPSADFRPGFKVNNYGFISPYDYPFKKFKKNQFVIGIFGGSVASDFSIFQVQNKILPQYLKQVPGLQDKEFIILSFATGGYKQPQQLLILNYFLALGQELDMVINIDGFNEVALSNINNKNKIDLAMPSNQHISPLTSLANNSLSTKALQATIRIKETKTQINEGLESLQHCSLAACDALTSVYVQNLVNNYRRDVILFEKERSKNQQDDEGSVIYINKNKSVLEDDAAFEQMAWNWAKSSIFMHKVLSASKVPYFHVLQPNQYYQTKRVFSDAEKRIAFNKDTPYANSVEIGYPALLGKFPNLQKNQINILNGVKVFDKTKDVVYVDSCCHYNKTGEEIFSNYVGSSIVEALRKDRASSNKK